SPQGLDRSSSATKAPRFGAGLFVGAGVKRGGLAAEKRDADVPEPRKTPVTEGHAAAVAVMPASRLLGAVGVAGLAHLLTAWGILAALGDVGPGARPAVVAVVVSTLAFALGVAARAGGEGLD